MDEATTSDDWADRQQAQAAGFDAIGTRYDEVFPHKEGHGSLAERAVDPERFPYPTPRASLCDSSLRPTQFSPGSSGAVVVKLASCAMRLYLADRDPAALAGRCRIRGRHGRKLDLASIPANVSADVAAEALAAFE